MTRPEDFALIELTGADRLEWLQGQATNDVAALAPGNRLSFCFCEPTGQILAPVDALALDDRILMAVPKTQESAVLERIERMTILEDVAARGLSSEEIAEAPPVAVAFATEADRLEAGVPKWGVDFGPRTLPAEMGSAFEAAHVSYAKGCYTGQEVLMRMHARGHSNRTWVGLVAAGPLVVGAEVLHEGRPVGQISSVAASPRFGAVAAATLRNEATAEGTKVTVDGVEAEVRSMPIRRTP